MGGVARVISGLFGGGGGGGGSTQVVYKPAPQAPTPAQPAAPAAEVAAQDAVEDTSLKKRRRGKSGLLVNPLNNNNAPAGSGTGLNL